MKFIKEHILFVFILSICLLLRLIPLFDYQFTLDELSGLNRTDFNSFGELMEKGVKIDAHPAFVQIVIYYLSRVFGYSNWIIKLPFLLFGFGAIIYAYFFALRNFSKQVAVFSATVFSFSLIFVFYAPIARMYISGVFFSMALLFYFFEIFFLNSQKRLNYVWLGFFGLLCALNQHMNALFAFTVFASGFLFLNKSNARPYLITCVLTVLCYLPHLKITLYQLGVGGIGYEQGGWLDVPKLSAVLGFLKILLGTGKMYLLFLALMALAILTNKKAGFNKKQVFLLSVFMLNYLIIYVYSVYRAPVFQNSVMLFSATAIVIFICSLLEFKNVYLFYAALLLVASSLLYKSYVKKDYLHQAVKTIFEYQFERTAHYKKLYGDRNVYPIFFDADETMKKIYFNKYTPFDCLLISDPGGASMKQFSKVVAGLSCDYLVLASSMPAHQCVAQEQFPYLIENTQTQGVNYKVYSKRKEDQNKVVPADAVLMTSTPASPGVFRYSKLKPAMLKETALVLKGDSLIEYPFDAEAGYSDVITHEGQMLLLKTKFKLNEPVKSQLSSCLAVSDKVSSETYKFTSYEASDFVMKPDSITINYTDVFFGTRHKHIKDKAKITCFVWNKGKEKFSMTDFEIKVIDFWPKKWQFWD